MTQTPTLVTLQSQTGQSSSAVFFSSPQPMGFDPNLANGVIISRDRQSVSSGFGSAQGAMGYVKYARGSSGQESNYWEYTWTSLNPGLLGGIGVCSIFANYASLAANGDGGVILTPDGTLMWLDSSGVLNNQNIPGMAYGAGDTIGILMDFNFGTANTAFFQPQTNNIAESQIMPPGLYVPCVVFDSRDPLVLDEVKANFLGIGLVWPSINGPFDPSVTLGWPPVA